LTCCARRGNITSRQENKYLTKGSERCLTGDFCLTSTLITQIKNVVLLACLAGLSSADHEPRRLPKLTAKEAHQHIGETATVCGKVVGARISKYAVGDHGKPITFDLDQPEPQRVFFFVTWSPDPAKLQQTKEAYDRKRVCVTGKIQEMGAVPHILATEPSQIAVEGETK
jgi:hypothetical protein